MNTNTETGARPIQFRETATACGNLYRAAITVADAEFRLEMGLDRTWLNIIDSESGCESCVVDQDGDVISTSGEYVTEAWTAADWQNLSKSVRVIGAQVK